MKPLTIFDIEDFKAVYKVDLVNEPNQNFDLYIQDYTFNVDIRTYVNDKTRIKITLNNEVLANYSPIELENVNLCYFSNFKEGVFFFVKDNDVSGETINYEILGKGLNLYYGII